MGSYTDFAVVKSYELILPEVHLKSYALKWKIAVGSSKTRNQDSPFFMVRKEENEDNKKEKNEDEVTAQCDSSTYDI